MFISVRRNFLTNLGLPGSSELPQKLNTYKICLNKKCMFLVGKRNNTTTIKVVPNKSPRYLNARTGNLTSTTGVSTSPGTSPTGHSKRYVRPF